MSVYALSRILEVVAKSVKHATAMSTILAQRDAAIASSKILSNHSSHAQRNAPINSQLFFDNKIKKWQNLILKHNIDSWSLPLIIGPYNLRNHLIWLQVLHGLLCLILESLFLREAEMQDSSPPLNMPCLPQSSESQPFPLPILPFQDILVGGRLSHFVEH